MPRTFDQILAGLAALKPEDFDFMRLDSYGPERLNALTDELMLLPQPERGVRAMFEVIERLSESDLGSPGPLVHTLEQMSGQYENELVESIKRKPTPLNVWMITRILNVTDPSEQRQYYLDLLKVVVQHPTATEEARQYAQDFIEHQNGAA